MVVPTSMYLFRKERDSGIGGLKAVAGSYATAFKFDLNILFGRNTEPKNTGEITALLPKSN